MKARLGRRQTKGWPLKMLGLGSRAFKGMHAEGFCGYLRAPARPRRAHR